MPSVSEYTVERRGGKCYLYRPDGSKFPGQEAFAYDREEVAKLYQLAAQLNKKSAHLS